ncbi:MAG: hypothetical protein Q8M33_15815, partial [Hydrogenophaga sp.]|nr:hypothetical protein [Hydrogenophaga sp.]
MLVDTQPATHQHVPASPEVRRQWVDSKLIDVLMDSAMSSLFSATLALPIMLYLMVGEVNTLALAVWTLLLLALLLYRYRMIVTYRMRYDSTEGSTRKDFIRRFGWSWAAVGALWGASTGLTFLQASMQTQLVCGLVVLGHGLLSLTAFSAYLPVFRSYTNALVVSVLLGMVVPMLLGMVPVTGYEHVVLLGLLLLVFWRLLRTAGERLHQVQRSSLELQFFNQELIDSLTQQTRASLRAVATKNRFLASAAHDLRQPVHALSLYADWL